MDFQTRARRIRLLLFDVDGVLTDGTILLYPDGTEAKRFNIRDGTAIVWAQKAGLRTGVLSGRSSHATVQRARQLGMPIIYQGVADKVEAFEQILAEESIAETEVAYMADDLLDLPVLGRVGLSAAPANAAHDVRSRVDWISQSAGGAGAAREFIEAVLRAQGRWDAILNGFAAEHPAR
ncbi:MAG TPA: HAD hydrolase family protein [Vicinamibacterales bacterium]|nr:HAD hydrolase family protein [Vicinamibacterales bacterium]